MRGKCIAKCAPWLREPDDLIAKDNQISYQAIADSVRSVIFRTLPTQYRRMKDEANYQTTRC